MSLVFTNYTEEQLIRRYGPDHEAPMELVSSSRSQSYPQYSNNGKWLAFSSNRSGHQEIWIANADGSQPRQLTSLRHQLTEVGHWSPADDLIAFVSQGRGPRQLYLIDPRRWSGDSDHERKRSRIGQRLVARRRRLLLHFVTIGTPGGVEGFAARWRAATDDDERRALRLRIESRRFLLLARGARYFIGAGIRAAPH